jgi:hypothetical protein
VTPSTCACSSPTGSSIPPRPPAWTGRRDLPAGARLGGSASPTAPACCRRRGSRRASSPSCATRTPGGRVKGLDRCVGANLGDRVARGYVTIDSMTACVQSAAPTSASSRAGRRPQPPHRQLHLRRPLRGPGLTRALGPLEASATHPATAPGTIRYTFYSGTRCTTRRFSDNASRSAASGRPATSNEPAARTDPARLSGSGAAGSTVQLLGGPRSSRWLSRSSPPSTSRRPPPRSPPGAWAGSRRGWTWGPAAWPSLHRGLPHAGLQPCLGHGLPAGQPEPAPGLRGGHPAGGRQGRRRARRPDRQPGSALSENEGPA